jgi:hypothetical protein
MKQWRATPVHGGWQLDFENFHGHRLGLRRVTPSGLYRVYLNGRSLGCWRGKDTAMAAAEWAALLRNAPTPVNMMRGVRKRVIGGMLATLESRLTG